MSKISDIAIVGPGRVGATLGVLAARAGYRIVGVAGRNEQRARAAAARIGRGIKIGSPAEIAGAGKLVLLTVSDDAIEPLCRELAQAGAFSKGAVVAHCCGALSSEVLATARQCGAAVGSMHPLQTFPDVDAGIAKFPGTYCFCEGDEPAVAELEAFARAIGGKPVRMSSAGKLLYHASAVMACNYLTALLDAALATAEKADIPRKQALDALEPLVRATLDNVFSRGPAGALTGPIARGDTKLVADQSRDVAAASEDLGLIYRVLGTWSVELALRSGAIDPDRADALRSILKDR